MLGRQAVGPSGDHLVQTESDRLTGFEGGLNLGAVPESELVVDVDGVGELNFSAVTLNEGLDIDLVGRSVAFTGGDFGVFTVSARCCREVEVAVTFNLGD